MDTTTRTLRPRPSIGQTVTIAWSNSDFDGETFTVTEVTSRGIVYGVLDCETRTVGYSLDQIKWDAEQGSPAQQIHFLTRRPSTTFHDDLGYFETAETLRVNGLCYGLGGWDETTTGRLVFEGPLVRGPQAFAFGLAVVITAHREVDTKTYVDARMGDLVRIDGVTYRIVSAPNRNIELVREPSPAEQAYRAADDAASVERDRAAWASQDA
jgi:hypothetical protein